MVKRMYRGHRSSNENSDCVLLCGIVSTARLYAGLYKTWPQTDVAPFPETQHA